MSKVTVSEAANHHGLTAEVLLDALQRSGIRGLRSHTSLVDEDQVRRAVAALGMDPGRRRKQGEAAAPPGWIPFHQGATVSALAKSMGLETEDVLRTAAELGVPMTPGDAIDAEQALLVASQFGYEVASVGKNPQDLWLRQSGKKKPFRQTQPLRRRILLPPPKPEAVSVSMPFGPVEPQEQQGALGSAALSGNDLLPDADAACSGTFAVSEPETGGSTLIFAFSRAEDADRFRDEARRIAFHRASPEGPVLSVLLRRAAEFHVHLADAERILRELRAEYRLRAEPL